MKHLWLDVIAAVGLWLFGCGLWLIYPPLILLFAGAGLVAFAVWLARIIRRDRWGY